MDLVNSAKNLKGQEVVDFYLEFFKSNLAYSLSPGKSDGLDDFLFDNKLGFCSHFASALAILLRQHDIPVRVITGFLGGEYNELGGYYIVRQKNAHSWVEVYVNNRWNRIDPSIYVNRSLVTNGRTTSTSSLSSGNLFLANFYKARHYFDNLQNRYNLFMSEYNLATQYSVFKKLFNIKITPYKLAAAVLILSIIFVFFFT